MWMLLLACGDLVESPPPPPATYTVVRGDSLSLIARRRGTTVDALRSLNAIDGDRIDIGQVLVLPSDTSPDSVTSGRETGRTERRPRPALSKPNDDPEPVGRDDATRPIVPRLARPPAQDCLRTVAGDGDRSMVASAGLSQSDAHNALSQFASKTSSCLVGLDEAPTSALPLVLKVGCDGRVDQVSIVGDHDWPDEHAQCLRQAHLQVPFPAHGLPDGDIVEYPIRLY